MDLKYRHKNLSDYAYKKIKTLILNDILKNGEKIVQEKMAKKLGISKIPIIQAHY
ncbi:MAG: GntR family transcriptional regulator [Cyanobacteria bacterium]|nr:GntR family transcriptional regulator [Cyanobacteriota bacterium]